MSKSTEADRLTRMLKALAHPNRLRLFEEIRKAGETLMSGHGCLLGQIVQKLQVGAPTVSHHLKELVNAGLVSTERQGKYVLCRVDVTAIDRLAAFFAHS
jgi:DNA-binding transcriptional ArsR family regulator